MNYWLFLIMYDWPFRAYWQDMVKAGIAAQHYPPGWTNESCNVKALCQLRQGDFIVAAFRKHRFAGYGVLTSEFYRDGNSLEVYDPRTGRSYEFAERFDCHWTVLPFNGDKVFIDCKDLKAQGFDIDLIRGLCVKQIDRETFEILKSRLDKAGAQRFFPQPNKARADNQDAETNGPASDVQKQDGHGGGFSKAEMNRQVESAAISFVTQQYETEGWKVTSVEDAKCGYDLYCVKGSVEKHVEVKGVQGTALSFIITANEVRQAETDPDFVLGVITSALAEKPVMYRYRGKEFIAKFNLEILEYRASLRVE